MGSRLRSGLVGEFPNDCQVSANVSTLQTEDFAFFKNFRLENTLSELMDGNSTEIPY